MRVRWRRIGLAILVLLALLLAWEPSRVAMQTAMLLPTLIDAGRPLNLVTAPPTRSTVPYWEPSGPREDAELAELWLPNWASPERRAGAMLLVFGVNDQGRNHPAIMRVAEGLARSGVAVLVPEWRSMIEGRLRGGEPEKIAAAFDLLAERPEVDPERVGIFGFSVGGSLTLVAAADPAIADRIAWLDAFGAYADTSSYLASVASHAYIGADGSAVAWEPAELTRRVFKDFMLDEVDRDADRRALQGAYANAIMLGVRLAPNTALRDRLGSDGRAVYDLLMSSSWDEARAAVDALPTSTRRIIGDISPLEHLDGLGTKVYLMHEVADRWVPFVESQELAVALDSDGRLQTHTEFRLFDHVQPEDLDPMAAAPELWKLLWHLHELMTETL
ncbi:MAG: prolyl oligopeptidase family serine peptidase [Candidatus Limnocylindria bacterium]